MRDLQYANLTDGQGFLMGGIMKKDPQRYSTLTAYTQMIFQGRER